MAQKRFVDQINNEQSSRGRDIESRLEQILSQKPDQRSFSDKLISRSGHLIHKLKAKDSTGRWAYYFVLVQPQHESKFNEAINGTGIIDLEAHGQVIASCYGDGPTQEIKDILREKYGFEV